MAFIVTALRVPLNPAHYRLRLRRGRLRLRQHQLTRKNW
jgi:hypothetical protein